MTEVFTIIMFWTGVAVWTFALGVLFLITVDYFSEGNEPEFDEHCDVDNARG